MAVIENRVIDRHVEPRILTILSEEVSIILFTRVVILTEDINTSKARPCYPHHSTLVPVPEPVLLRLQLQSSHVARRRLVE